MNCSFARIHIFFQYIYNLDSVCVRKLQSGPQQRGIRCDMRWIQHMSAIDGTVHHTFKEGKCLHVLSEKKNYACSSALTVFPASSSPSLHAGTRHVGLLASVAVEQLHPAPDGLPMLRSECVDAHRIGLLITGQVLPRPLPYHRVAPDAHRRVGGLTCGKLFWVHADRVRRGGKGGGVTRGDSPPVRPTLPTRRRGRRRGEGEGREAGRGGEGVRAGRGRRGWSP